MSEKKIVTESKISALILSWNEIEVLKLSVEKMKNENLEIWVVDNGSSDGTQEWLNDQKNINKIIFKENKGSSVARNAVIDKFTGDYLLMLDCDILYIKGAARGLLEGLEKIKDAYVLGIDYRNSTDEINKSTEFWLGAGDIKQDIPVAFTNFGIFNGDLIRKYRFPTEGAFGEPGWGAEDDYLNALMNDAGFKAFNCKKPMYFHKAHSGARQLAQSGVDLKKNRLERIRLLLKRFPNYPIKIVDYSDGTYEVFYKEE